MEEIKKAQEMTFFNDLCKYSHISTKQIGYRNESGYGQEVDLYICTDLKSDTKHIIRHTYYSDGIVEEVMSFDVDSFEYFKELLNNN